MLVESSSLVSGEHLSVFLGFICVSGYVLFAPGDLKRNMRSLTICPFGVFSLLPFICVSEYASL